LGAKCFRLERYFGVGYISAYIQQIMVVGPISKHEVLLFHALKHFSHGLKVIEYNISNKFTSETKFPGVKSFPDGVM
jgi:hypothetical protein